MYENEASKFYYIIDFSKDGISLNAQVQEKPIKLDEETLGKILDVPIVGVRTMVKQQPTTKFMINVPKMGGTSITAVKKKFLISEF